MKVLHETSNYAIVKYGALNEGQQGWDGVYAQVLNDLEELRLKGFRPLHYLPRFSAWVCEKDGYKQAA